MDYIPEKKRSKREQRELNALRRGSWGGLNPVTRTPPKSGAYRRGDAKREAARRIREEV